MSTDAVPPPDLVDDPLVRVAVLGSTEVTVNGRPVDVPRGNGRLILSVLAVGWPAAVRDEVLLERVWGDEPAKTARYSLRNTIARLRTLLGKDTILRIGDGYGLNVVTTTLDLVEFEQHSLQADAAFNEGRAQEARDLLAAALGLVRGQPFVEVRDEWWARSRAAVVDEAVRDAEERWAATALTSEMRGADIARLHQLAIDEPLRERRWTVLVRALGSAGRTTEALRAANQARAALASHGLVPGAELIAAERELTSAPTPRLVWTAGSQLLERHRASPMVGREDVLGRVHPLRRLTWISGVKGIGKTRLMSELAARERNGGNLVVYVAVSEGDREQPLLLSIGAELVALGARPSVARSELPPSSPRLGDVLAMTADLVATGTVVVLIDDVDLASPSAIPMLTELVHSCPSAVRFVMSSGPLGKDRSQRHFETISERMQPVSETLRPLSVRAVAALVTQLHATLPVEVAHEQAGLIVEATGGHPALVLQLAEGPIGAESESEMTPFIDDTFPGFRSPRRALIDALLAAGAPLRRAVVAAAAEVDDATASRELDDLVRLGVVLQADDLVQMHPGRVAAHVDRPLTRQESVALQARLVTWLTQDDERALRTELLVELRAHGHDAEVDVDVEVATTVRELLAEQRPDHAHRIGRRYVDVVGLGNDGPASLRAHFVVGMAALRNGDAPHALQLFDFVGERAQRLGDMELLTDVILERAQLDSGSAQALAMAEQAELALERLPVESIDRRRRLAGIAAHHRLNRGRRSDALALLDLADELLVQAPDAADAATLLTLRAQAELLADGSPTMVFEVLGALRCRRDETPSALIGELLTALPCAYLRGDITSVQRVIAELSSLSEHTARPDVLWLPYAARAGLALAVGDLDAAAARISEAEEFGRKVSAGGTESTSMLQRGVLMHQSGALAMMVGPLSSAATAADARQEIIATWGLAAVSAGDLASAQQAAGLLHAVPSLLADTGNSWSMMAMAVAELAWACRDQRLAAIVHDALEPWSGTGLTAGGVAYFGAADTWIGLTAAVSGDHSSARARLEAAVAQELARGTIPWADRARAALLAVG